MKPEMIKDLFDTKRENKILKDRISALMLDYKNRERLFENSVRKEVEVRTKELNDTHKKEIDDYKNVIKDQAAEIDALKRELAKVHSIIDNNSYNSGLPTSKTKIGEKKYVPNTREKSDKKIGGQKGHPKHKLEKFDESEATKIIEIVPDACPKCGNKEIIETSEYTDKCEIDYVVKVEKIINRFRECKCRKCGNLYHAPIPNDLKEEVQYGKTVQSLAVCLTNEIYTPFNKTVKLISGLTDGEINMSEGFVAKLQKRAYDNLEKFEKELNNYFPKQYVYGWDDGVISINGKDACFRTYCTDNVTLFKAHEKKDKASIDEDNILSITTSCTTVMHDHLKVNYNDDYDYKNVECAIHLIRRLRKMEELTKHKWLTKLNKLLSETIHERNQMIDKNDYFTQEKIDGIKKEYSNIIDFGMEEYENTETKNLNEDELTLLKDLKKYKENYLLWIDDEKLPTTNNNSERSLRPIKSKMKISGQFKNIKYAEYYARIRSYIETCKRNGINIIDACEKLLNNNPYTLNEILPKEKDENN